MNSSKITYRWLCFAGCLIVAFLFCLKFSVTTSFLYKGIHGADSAIFYIIGKYWAQGFLPYVDLWDHKGPMIFFINCIGHLLTGNKTGVFIIQVFSLSVFIYFTFLTFRRKFSLGVSSLLTLLSLFWLACSYEAGNLTEEYLLPYLAAAIYFTVKWLEGAENHPTDYNPWNAFLLGFILGFSFLTRLTNALGACGIMLAIGVILIIRKQWGNLWRIALFYLLGFVFVLIPFFIYFQTHGALQEMLYGSIGFNFDNILQTSQKSAHAGFGVENLIKAVLMCVNSIGLSMIAVCFLIKGKRWRLSAFVWFTSSLLISAWLLSSNLSSHYRTLTVPYFPILISSLFLLRDRPLLRVLRISILSLLIIGPVFITSRKWSSFVSYFDDRESRAILCMYLEENGISSQTDSFVGYSILQGVYLDLNIKPRYHNFSFQETQAMKSSRLQNDILKEFETLAANSILVNGEDVLIKDILNTHYSSLPSPPGLPQYHLWVRKSVASNIP